ncbi:hypothetical protein RJ55_08700 [Drechmeria coniospora]|nr:hypothetical protein RJ55_08700 [Drechmeria coniospora]
MQLPYLSSQSTNPRAAGAVDIGRTICVSRRYLVVLSQSQCCSLKTMTVRDIQNSGAILGHVPAMVWANGCDVQLQLGKPHWLGFINNENATNADDVSWYHICSVPWFLRQLYQDMQCPEDWGDNWKDYFSTHRPLPE